MIQTLVHMASGRIKPELRCATAGKCAFIVFAFCLVMPNVSVGQDSSNDPKPPAVRTLYGEVSVGGEATLAPPIPVVSDAPVCAPSGEIPQLGLGEDGTPVANALIVLSENDAVPDLTDQTTMAIRLRNCAFQYDVHFVRPRQLISFENADSIVVPVSLSSETGVMDTFDIMPGTIATTIRAPRAPGVYCLQGLRNGWMYCYLIVSDTATQTLRTDAGGRFRSDVAALARGTVSVYWTKQQVRASFSANRQVRYKIPPLQRTDASFDRFTRDDLRLVLQRDKPRPAGKVVE